MTASAYLRGVVLLATIACSLAFGGWLLRSRLLPAWTGAPARLAEAVIALSGFVLASELLGIVGALRRLPLALSCLALAAGAWAWARRRKGAQGGRPPPAPSSGLVAIGIGAFAAVIALASWMVYTRTAFQKGMLEFDTLWYHMPFAARFAEEGSLVHVHYVGDASPTYLPATSELFHAADILAFSNDLLSPALNLGWLGLAFLAAWCIGRPAGLGPATLAACALVVAGANFAETQAGSAKNDIVGLALLLAAVALIVAGRDEPPALGIAGLAAGLAVGTRLNALAAVLALTVSVVALNPGRRRLLAVWGLGLLATGNFWYVRNLAATGNPLPWFGLGLGPLTLHSVPPPFDCGNTTLADYAGRLGAAHRYIGPQLSGAFGPAWPLLLAVPAAGIVAGIAQRRARLPLVLALVALATTVAYVFTPAGAGGHAASCFGNNTRFAAQALVLGAVILPLALVRTRLPQYWVVAAIAVAIVLDVPHEASTGGRVAVAAGGALGVVLAIALVQRRALSPRLLAGALALGSVLVAVAGWTVQKHYLRDRYARGGLTEPIAASYLRLRDLDDARIAAAGFLGHYPLYGRDSDDTVVLPAVRTSHGGFRAIRSCPEWLAALDAGRYDYVVTAPGERGRVPPETAWTRADPKARQILRVGHNVVFRLDHSGGTRGSGAGCGTLRSHAR